VFDPVVTTRSRRAFPEGCSSAICGERIEVADRYQLRHYLRRDRSPHNRVSMRMIGSGRTRGGVPLHQCRIAAPVRARSVPPDCERQQQTDGTTTKPTTCREVRWTRNDPRHLGACRGSCRSVPRARRRRHGVRDVIRLARNLVRAPTRAAQMLLLGSSARGTSTSVSGRASPLDPIMMACSTVHPRLVCAIPACSPSTLTDRTVRTGSGRTFGPTPRDYSTITPHGVC